MKISGAGDIVTPKSRPTVIDKDEIRYKDSAVAYKNASCKIQRDVTRPAMASASGHDRKRKDPKEPKEPLSEYALC